MAWLTAERHTLALPSMDRRSSTIRCTERISRVLAIPIRRPRHLRRSLSLPWNHWTWQTLIGSSHVQISRGLCSMSRAQLLYLHSPETDNHSPCSPALCSQSIMLSLLWHALPASWRSASAEMQVYQQELRNQAAALAGHMRLGWINCGDPGNDIICNEQMSKLSGRINETEDMDDAEEPHFDAARLPAVLMCGLSLCARLSHRMGIPLLCLVA